MSDTVLFWISVDSGGFFTSFPSSGGAVPSGARQITAAQAAQIRENFTALYWPASAQWPLVKPLPAPPPRIPQEVALFQARILLAGMPSTSGDATKTFLDDVDAAIKARGANSPAAIAWQYGNTVSRTGPLVTAMAAQFSLSAAQLDQMFTQAAAIVV